MEGLLELVAKGQERRDDDDDAQSEDEEPEVQVTWFESRSRGCPCVKAAFNKAICCIRMG